MTSNERARFSGLQILELAQCSKRSYRTALSIAELTPTYLTRFDLFVKGAKSEGWLTALDDFRNWLAREAA
jgi:hypothetical protein